MRKAAVYLLFIFAALALALAITAYGLYQIEVAKAEESFLVFDFADAEAKYRSIRKHLDRGRRIPWLGDSITGIEVRKAEVDYWQREYRNLTSRNVVDQQIQNPTSSFIRANSFYRSIESDKDRKKVIEGLESAIAAYLETIKGDEWNVNAVFDYEYLVRLRNDAAKRKRPLPIKKPGEGNLAIHGQEGQQAKESGTNTIKIHIPISGEEIKKLQEGQDAGKGEVKRGKG